MQRFIWVFEQYVSLLDQINCHVDPRSLKFKKNMHGKPEVSLCFCFLEGGVVIY